MKAIKQTAETVYVPYTHPNGLGQDQKWNQIDALKLFREREKGSGSLGSHFLGRKGYPIALSIPQEMIKSDVKFHGKYWQSVFWKTIENDGIISSDNIILFLNTKLNLLKPNCVFILYWYFEV